MATTPKQVKALLLNPPDDRIGVKLDWIANQETDLDHYNVYRGGCSVFGEISQATYNVSDGDTLILRIDGRAQIITLSNTYITDGAATVAELMTNLNADLIGATAYQTTIPDDPTLLLRSNNTGKRGWIQVMGGTAASVLGFPAFKFRNNKNLTEFQQIGTVLATATTTFTDLDGLVGDYYYVEAVTTEPLTGQASVIKSLEKIVDEIPNKIVIYGRLYDAGGDPLESTEVILRPCSEASPSLNYRDTNFQNISSADFGITFQDHSVLTDADGYFEIVALASTKLRLVIPAINYDQQILTETVSADFVDLRVVG